MIYKTAAINGFKWSSVLSVSVILINVLKISIFSREINANDFGVMAIVVAVLSILELFVDFGISASIFHFKKISLKEYSSIFWTNILFSVFVFLILFILSPLIANLYKNPQLEDLLKLASTSVLFAGFGKVQKAIVQKNLKFKIIAIIELASNLVSLIIGIYLLGKVNGIYVLIYSFLISTLLSNLIFFTRGFKEIKSYNHLNFKLIKKHLSFGMYHTFGQLLNYINRDLDVLIISFFYPINLVGNVSLAKQLAYRPLQVIIPIINRVAVPLFPKYQNDSNFIKKLFLNLTFTATFFFSFFYSFLLIWSTESVLIIYGQKHISIVQFLSIYSLIFFIRSIGSFIGVISITKGKTIVDFFWNLLLMLFTSLFLFVLSQTKFNLILNAITGLFILNTILLIPMWYSYYKLLLEINFTAFFSKIIPFLLIVTSIFILLNSIEESSMEKILMSILIIILFVLIFIKNKDLILKYHRNDVSQKQA